MQLPYIYTVAYAGKASLLTIKSIRHMNRNNKDERHVR